MAAMQRALSTHLFLNRKLTTEILQQVEETGVPTLEIFCARQHFDYADRSQVREIAAWFADHDLQLRSLHAPMFSDFDWGHSGSHAEVNLAAVEPLRRQEAIDQVKRALEVAERAPFRYMVLHLGMPGESYHPRKVDAAGASLEELRAFAQPLGVEFLLENIPNQLSTPQRLREFMEKTGFGDLRVCFDTGHAHLGGGVGPDFEALRDLVVSTHVHDNDGSDDAHLFPFEGGIRWEEAMPLLGAADPELPLQPELREYGMYADPLAKALEIFHRLEELIPTPQS